MSRKLGEIFKRQDEAHKRVSQWAEQQKESMVSILAAGEKMNKQIKEKKEKERQEKKEEKADRKRGIKLQEKTRNQNTVLIFIGLMSLAIALITLAVAIILNIYAKQQ